MAIDTTLFSETERVVFLIDLDPLFHLPDPSPYLTTLISATKTVLSFPPLSSSLFSFKLFFSSLSPLLSASKLASLSLFFPSLSFDRPELTFLSLTRTFESLSRSALGSSKDVTKSRGVHVAASLRQLLHDYAWDLEVRDPVIGRVLGSSDDDSTCVKLNLVLLFSPVLRDLNKLVEFLDLRIDDERLQGLNIFDLKFQETFGSVNESLSRRDIHVCWVDLKCPVGSDCPMNEPTDSRPESNSFESGIRNLCWGYCSTDSVVLGSVIVPFGLIYPAIGIPSHFQYRDKHYKKFYVETTLELLDVNGRPLECKCNALELAELRISPRSIRSDIMNSRFPEGIKKICVKAVRVLDDTVRLKNHVWKTFILREIAKDSNQDQAETIREFYAYRVLQLLAKETGGSVTNGMAPVWQIILSFLYREGYLALVSLLHGGEDSYVGILKPLTFSSAILSIIDSKCPSLVQGAYGSRLESMSIKSATEMEGADACLSHSFKPKDTVPITSSDPANVIMRGSKKAPIKDLTWSAFVLSALDRKEMDLGDAYFAKFNSLKKLKYLKCWIKQFKKFPGCSFAQKESTEPPKEIRTPADQKIEEERDQMIPNKIWGTQEMGDHSPNLEQSKNFFSSLPNKIQQGLESEEVDGRALAERIVNICTYHLSKEFNKEIKEKGKTSSARSEDPYNTRVVDELTFLLLKQPKELVAKHRKDDSSVKASNSASAEDSSNLIIREYELQIFFRMETLRSEIGAGMEESTKQKFVKQICLFLEAIQCRLDGGFFGDWSLEKYVAKIIKSRYNQTLGDIVNKIYAKMDLLLLRDEEESSNSLFNSEESNHPSCGEKHEIKNPTATAKQSYLLAKTEKENLKGREGQDACELLEAQERRERARRFASFTSWIPDLQRVWAPKQLKAGKAKRLRKRKERQGTGCDKVCETPLTDYKRPCGRDQHERRTPSGGTVSKALFQDDKT